MAILAVLLSTWTSTRLVLRYPVGQRSTTDVFAPSCFPFTIVGFHDFENQQFAYRIVFGWPDGIPILLFELMDDQSEFMNEQRFKCSIILGLLSLLGALLAVFGIFTLEAGIKQRSPVKQEQNTIRANVSFG